MKQQKTIIRPIESRDLIHLWEIKYSDEHPEWKKWDAPYFEHKSLTLADFLSQKESIVGLDDYWAITVDEKVIGTVSYYWEHEPSMWLEMGIGIYDPAYWNGGYGTEAFRMWIDHLFESLPIVRAGYTTWSGNTRMIKVGEKLGMTVEGRMRKCRVVEGKYYDSVRVGILREEWEALSAKRQV
ncbi:GNAT family N-acetyltransferase [Metabacillus sp. JX24]|uniref:GNAT family N-acetyltransferase n=1 Tax=Metabacillus sp. JX24 TaxID=3240759 RepID=UPI00350F9456